MARTATIKSVRPKYAIPGGEIGVECVGFDASYSSADTLRIDETDCHIASASSTRIIATIPEDFEGGYSQLSIDSDGKRSELFPLITGKKLVDGMHIVANPAIDPTDDALILTRSGSRGQQLPATLFRLEPDGYFDEMPEPILNPTGIAFDKDGRMFVTNRAQGEVYLVAKDGTTTVYATGMGVATGIAFNPNGGMYVGDRLGTIFCVSDFADVEVFAKLEPSVAAYHLAFSPDERLYITAPGLASHDAVYAIDKNGDAEIFARGFGRPQGLAFDANGNLYVVACYQGHHGVVRISPDGKNIEPYVAGNNVIGLCFSRRGDMIVATADSVFSIPCGIKGVLLDGAV